MEVEDSEGLCVDRLRYDGDSDFKGLSADLAKSLSIEVETNAPCVPQGNLIGKREFDMVIYLVKC